MDVCAVHMPSASAHPVPVLRNVRAGILTASLRREKRYPKLSCWWYGMGVWPDMDICIYWNEKVSICGILCAEGCVDPIVGIIASQ